MSSQKLTPRQIAFRTLFMLAAIAIVSWFFPHSEAFRYEYEVGKPWRYGRLTAPYDFAILRSDSAIMQMEDSLRRQIVPRYRIDATVGETALRELSRSHMQLSTEAAAHLKASIQQIYSLGIISVSDREQLDRLQIPEAILSDGKQSVSIPTSQLYSEKQAFEVLRQDSLFAADYAPLPLQRYLRSNLVTDTIAMHLEYSRLRQQVSTTSGIVLAESRIIDNGEIVTPHTYDVLESYRHEQQQRRRLMGDETLTWVGRILLVSLLLCSVLLFLYLYRHWVYEKQAEVFVAIGAMVLMVALTSLANRLVVGAVYLVPIGIVTILLCTFHGSRTAYFCHIIMVLLCSFIAPSHYEYLIVQCIVGMIIIFNLKDGLQDRSQLMRVSIMCLIGYTGLYALYTLANEGTLSNISWPILTMMAINALLLLTSYLIIYALENLFGFMSGVTLLELCNLGKGVLLRLSQEAPGTFQHAMQVANLSASAAKVIGANPALVRTGALYHDIGKLWNPKMYTENQQGTNAHDTLSIEDSVDIIKRHVYEGEVLARKEKLPSDIIDFIFTHHGRSQVKYFYIKWCNEHPDETPDPNLFNYPGPDPITPEQSILMMADSIEAASRSLREFSHESISKLVNDIVDSLVAAGRFNQSKISLREIQQCKESFIRDIESINHARIAYPEELKKQQKSL